MRNTRKDTLAPLYRRTRGEANQLAHNTNSLHSGRLTIKLAQGGRDAGEVWITFQSAANTVPCEHDFTRDCLTLATVLFASCRQSVRDGGSGDPPWHRNQHARSPLMLGTKRKRLKRKYGPSWWRCNFSERAWGSRMLLGSANLNGTLPASSICLVRSALFPDGCMRISMSCSLGVHVSMLAGAIVVASNSFPSCFCASRRGLPRTHASTQNQGHVDRPTFLTRHL